MRASEDVERGWYIQFEDGEIGQTVIFFAANLMIEIVLENSKVRWVVSVYGRDRI